MFEIWLPGQCIRLGDFSEAEAEYTRLMNTTHFCEEDFIILIQKNANRVHRAWGDMAGIMAILDQILGES